METKESVREEVLKFLNDNATAVIATSFNGEPYAATIYYGIDEDFVFYFVTKKNTSKMINMALNQMAAMVVGTGPKHITAQIKGTTYLLNDDEAMEAMEIMKDIRAREFVKDWPINEMNELKEKRAVAFKLIPSEITFMNLDDEAYPKSLGKEYHHIIP